MGKMWVLGCGTVLKRSGTVSRSAGATRGLFYVAEPLRVVIIGVQDLRRDPERLRDELLGRLP